ncbi:MAG: choice-of-anchor Q domain-containing protein [Candidatus Nanopelagicales bacterium]
MPSMVAGPGWGVGVRRVVAAVSAVGLAAGLMVGTAGAASAATFTVTNLNDSGAGSLRQAILDANGSPGADIITFAVTGTITLSSGELWVQPGGLTIQGPGAGQLIIDGNNATRVLLIDAGSTSALAGVTIRRGSTSAEFTQVGGGILNLGTLSVTDSVISGNSAGVGGGMANTGTATVTDSVISGNLASSGGGINNAGTATVVNSVISGNTAGVGGGMANTGTATVTDSTISANSATNAGGIDNTDTLSVTDSTISGNTAALAAGGIWNRDPASTATVTDSTISGNTADSGGGMTNTGTATVTDSTISGNSATTAGGGVFNTGTATVTASTISGNSATTAGGGAYNIGTAIVRGSIVANSVGADCSGPVLWLGVNLVEDGSCLPPPGTLTGDPDLFGLDDYGGPTKTLLPKPGSPVVDAGGPTCATAADQRGEPRPQGMGCDLGSVETQPGPLAFTSGAFGATTVGTAAPLSVTVTNPDTAETKSVPSTITATGSGVTVTGGTCSVGTPIPVAGACTVLLAWSPTSAGALSGAALTIGYPVGNSDTLPLTGTATAVIPPVALTVPGPPTGVTAAPGDGKATVSWTAPGSNGGSAITGYVVQQSVDAGTTWTAAAGSPAAATATSLTVTGLTNGINVSFRVAATNAVGQGPWSAPSVPVTPASGAGPTPPPGTATVTVTSPAASGSQISSNGYFGVSATSTGIPAGTTAYVTLNGSAKASTTVQAGGAIRFDGTPIGGNQWIPAETGTYAVRIGGGGGSPVLATSSTFTLVIIPFGLNGRNGNRYTVLPGNFSPGTTVYLTRNSATVASGKVQTKEQPFTITGPTTPGTYQIWVASNQGRVYGDHAGVITIR